MSNFDFKLPDIGEGVAEGEIVAWHVKQGDRVTEDQPMVDVMTDKASVTIGAPKAGTIRELRASVGAVVKVGAVLVVIDTAGASASSSASTTAVDHPAPTAAMPSAASPTASASAAGPAATAVGDIRESLPGIGLLGGGAAKPAPKTNGSNGHGTSAYFREKPLATPATRKLARDLSIDLRKVTPTGVGGRVTNDDVRNFAQHGAATTAPAGSAVSTSTTAPAPRAPIAIAPSSSDAAQLDERKPFVGVRRRIAERMQTSKNTAAHFTFVEECDVTALKALRARLKSQAESQGVKLTFLPFIAKAVVAALKKHPILNSALDEATNELVFRRAIHLGIAAATDAGLMVPVLRDADRRSLLDVAREIDRLGNGARSGTLKPEELSGSTFTITSLGAQGGLFATPILNFPEVGILGVHQMKQKPVVREGQIVVGDVMLLSLSFDHRIVDGHVGAAFAYDIIAYLENPDRLFLEMT